MLDMNLIVATVIPDVAEAVDTDKVAQQTGIAAILLGLSIFLVFYALFAPKSPTSTRTMSTGGGDTGFDRYVRPMLRNFVPQTPLAAQKESKKLDATRELLVKSGNPWKIRAEEFLGIQVLFAALGVGLGLILFIFPVVPVVPPVLWPLIVPITFWFLPYSYHNTLRQSRGDQIRKQLPDAIDLIVIAMESGKTFEPALQTIAPALPEGLLKVEMFKLNAELNAGRGMSESLTDFAHRSSSEEAENFAKSIVQSQRLGASVTETLSDQARTAREAYEARVEKKISRLSSIMMIPLVFTMIPALILIILAPTLMDLMNGFGGGIGS